MAGPKYKHYADLPPPAERRCVTLGLAEITTHGGRPVMGYYWKKIAVAWSGWPNANLVEFCRAYHIPYNRCSERPEMSQRRKAAADAKAIADRHEMVLREMRVRMVRDAESEGRELALTLDAIQQIGGLGVRYAMAKLAKFSEGSLLPVASLPSQEVRRCMEIGWKAAEMLRTALELRRMADGSAGTDASRAEPVLREVPTAARSQVPAKSIVSTSPGADSQTANRVPPPLGTNGVAHP